ncbi:MULTISPECIES: ribonuclease HII [Dictyoglomus]|jgi:ribonuclease HII|uniref:Ribonuclease HII n=1 Tax=Dictyoglomus turgidum (strain DSM 6724 / Z-1310) TaxID=515635 RepID=B8E2G1_DICTD|nr:MULTISPECIES: ribonuclease HII [Dictyoglomus]ACK42805.1 Ribonuclease H [Dictyoglomus turgidum DSM 6724]PNV80988.1 MAG: ribonuclease HII [Dictyoglomus turgidum]HBU30864.1 ribonuclease HII [Dictyoglomus sp.]
MASPKNRPRTLGERERELWYYFRYIAGVDEAGRGALAGPVYAGAVILPPLSSIPVNDSKLLSPKEREELFEIIKKEALCWSFGYATVEEIEELGILKATLLAMRRAIEKLEIKPEYLLVDGNIPIPNMDIPQETIVKGDRKCLSIASASIVAKVLRDRYMKELDKEYPGYGFSRHKGYATKEHREKIKSLGSLLIHRKGFKLL